MTPRTRLALASAAALPLLAVLPASAASPVCAAGDAARNDACRLATALSAGAVAPGSAAVVTATVTTASYTNASGSGYRNQSWKGKDARATINGVAQPLAASTPSATIYDLSGKRYLIPSAVFNKLASGQTSTRPTITVDVGSSPIVAGATTFTMTLESVFASNRSGVKSTQAYTKMTIPLRKTFSVSAAAYYCADWDVTNLMCKTTAKRGTVTLKRTRAAYSDSTLSLTWTPPGTTRKVTDTVHYTVGSGGDERVTSTTAG